MFCFFLGGGQVTDINIYKNIYIGPIKTYCSYDKLTTKTDVVSNKGHQKFPPENEECVLDR